MNLRPCSPEGCRYCRPAPVVEEPDGETLAELLLGAAMLILVFIFAFVLLPVTAA